MPEITIAARRTEPRVHCWARSINGDYVRSDRTPPDHLANVFAAERERLAAAKPRRARKPRATTPETHPAQLQLVA
ncbi:hypothetical protein CHL79_15930 [Delftia acidovorans]|uniref:hypothetical protein n=1 Tax=Delftia acidovorans TaxID=80866 RepID=UPI000BC35458|nr:hypothetical protein [Delftia acidovorans]ATH13806.1 hypothetical protein CHL79_15930 [Delftia acidovorans]